MCWRNSFPRLTRAWIRWLAWFGFGFFSVGLAWFGVTGLLSGGISLWLPAGPPHQGVGLSPRGPNRGYALRYRILEDPAATWYQIALRDQTRGQLVSRWYKASEQGPPPVALSRHPGGNFTWWVRGWGPGGMGPWSDPIDFRTPHSGPVPPTLLEPDEGSVGGVGGFRWSLGRAAWYRFVLSYEDRIIQDQWVRPSRHPWPGAHAPGTYTWWVGAWLSPTDTRVLWSRPSWFVIP